MSHSRLGGLLVLVGLAFMLTARLGQRRLVRRWRAEGPVGIPSSSQGLAFLGRGILGALGLALVIIGAWHSLSG